MSDSYPDTDDADFDWDDDPDCSWCGGDGWEECDDPIQCCRRDCDGVEHRCAACHGSGLAKDQVIW